LNAAVFSDGVIPIEYFPRKKHQLTESVIVIAILFVSFLMMSNMTAVRISEIKLPWSVFGGNAEFQFPAALVLFPATYAFSTVLTEVYGYNISRLVIWGGLAANTLLVLGLWAISLLPTSPEWASHTGIGIRAYEELFFGYARTFAASSIAYFCSEFANTAILAKLKVASAGRHQALRILTSTGLAVGLDSAIFCTVLFWGVMGMRQIIVMAMVQISVKLVYELMLLPFTLHISRRLKARDGIDYYDSNTRFNQFAVKA
jgi:queuosine precursor transporter